MADNQQDPQEQNPEETDKTKIRMDRFTWGPGDLVLVQDKDGNPVDPPQRLGTPKKPKKRPKKQ